ncbi:serine hydrolase [Modestobacter sp. SYSU DS0875]
MTGARNRPAGVAVAGLLAVLLLLAVGCTTTGEDDTATDSSGGATAAPDTGRETPDTGRETRGADRETRDVDEEDVLREVEEAASGARATISAVVLGPQGATLVESPTAADPRDAASLVKLLVVHQVLDQAGPDGPDERTAGLLERAITVSDDEAMDLLWVERDGPALVRAAAEAFGLTSTAPPEDVTQWGETATSAVDLARFLRTLADRPDDRAAATLLDWMRAAADTAADGFDQGFGLLAEGLPAGEGEVAVKQAWACCPADRRQLHSAGVLPDGRVVVLLAEAPRSSGYGQLRAALDDAAAALVAGSTA